MVYRHDTRHFEKTGNWGSHIPDELDEKNRQLSASVSILIQRIDDNELRKELKELKSEVAKCILSETQFDAKHFHMAYNDRYEYVSEKIGQVLRGTYKPNA